MDEDFNTPSEERKVLLGQLQEAIGSHVSVHFWAACHLCDLECLEKFTKVASISPEIIHSFAYGAKTMIDYWIQRHSASSRDSFESQSSASASTGGTPGSGTFNTRSLSAKVLAKQRDNSCCVLTAEPIHIQVAHIYPFFGLKNKESILGQRHTFWDSLATFWPSDKIATWKQELFSEDLTQPGRETVQNLLTLSIGAHAAWNFGNFALKPLSVSHDNTILKVQFFWQKKQVDIKETTSLLTTPYSTQGLISYQTEGKESFLTHRLETIESGRIFEITTNDPQKKPLPSFALLEMQWFLTRIAGMAGASYRDDDMWMYDWDDSEEMPALDDKIEDSSFASNPLPVSPEFLRQVNESLTKGEHHLEEAQISEEASC